MSFLWKQIYFVALLLFEVCGDQENDEYTIDDGYGTEWMYFPDGEGIPQRISLDMPYPSSPFLRRAYAGDIEYRLYTRQNLNNYIILDQSAKPLNDSMAHITKKITGAPIKLVTHGWKSTADKSSVINIKNAYLKAQDVNVIAVDWSATSESIFYPVVAYQTKKIGSQVAKFLNALSEVYDVSGSKVHLIGHSLGAHVMGNAGSECNFKVHRITGLDPARPFFELPNRSDSVKLDISDAEFVDTIHTCGGLLGIRNAIGHADFFPNNGGAPQPGCSGFRPITEACSHSRSHFFFAESIINPKAFPSCQGNSWKDYTRARPCNNPTYMGDGVNESVSGIYYLKTNPAEPYGYGS